MLVGLLFILLKFLAVAYKVCAPCSFLAGALLMASDRKKRLGDKDGDGLVLLLSVAGFAGIATPVIWIVAPILTRLAVGKELGLSFFPMLIWLVLAVPGAVGTWWWMRHGVQRLEQLKARLTIKSSVERNKKTDVREIGKFIPPARGRFDPRDYMPKIGPNEIHETMRPVLERDDRLFVGLDENDEPVYIEYSLWLVSHILVSGRTRSGKGVVLQSLGWQAIQRGEFLAMLDPKPDNFLPALFKKACEEAGRPYRFIDINDHHGPQTNLFGGHGLDGQPTAAGCIENMLIGGFGLAPTGNPGVDHYRIADRAAAKVTAQWFAKNPGATAADAYAALAERYEQLAAADFKDKMHELASLPAVNRRGEGVDIGAGEREGGCLYVIGDMMNPLQLQVQKMILLRLMMMCKNRRDKNPRRVLVIADEFRVHISKPFMNGLGAAAGWGLHCALPFQAFTDLRECSSDLDPDAVQGSVTQNCAIQISYAIKGKATAEELAESTGFIQVDDEARRVTKNTLLSETADGERTIRQSERPLMDVNIITNLPVPNAEKGLIGCGILQVPSQLARFVYTSPIIVPADESATSPIAPADRLEEETQTGFSLAESAIALDDIPGLEPL